MGSHYKRVIHNTYPRQAFGLGSLEQTREPMRIDSEAVRLMAGCMPLAAKIPNLEF